MTLSPSLSCDLFEPTLSYDLSGPSLSYDLLGPSFSYDLGTYSLIWPLSPTILLDLLGLTLSLYNLIGPTLLYDLVAFLLPNTLMLVLNIHLAVSSVSPDYTNYSMVETYDYCSMYFTSNNNMYIACNIIINTHLQITTHIREVIIEKQSPLKISHYWLNVCPP